jgi:phosphate acetyltransferase
MELLERIRKQASKQDRHILLPEAQDERILHAAEKLIKEKICRVTILGSERDISSKANTLNISLKDIHMINPVDSNNYSTYVNQFYELRRHKRISEKEAEAIVKNPLYYGALMVRNGEVDGSVAGAINTTSDVLRAGIQCIGLKNNISVVSSSFLMIIPGWEQPLTYADAGVVPNPNADQLASIAIASSQTHKKLTGNEPFVAMLSFSTYGSASHPMVKKVNKATHFIKERAPQLKVDGELQGDAAIIVSVAEKKAPGSQVAGKANVLIFPNLDAGNICYKLTERLANARALGPIIQGLEKPVMDLSRGCSVDDIVDVVAICCLLTE